MAGLMSGIRPSDELLAAFAKAKDVDSNVRFLKVQIEGFAMAVTHTESVEGSAESDFAAVSAVLEDEIPCYILFKLDGAREGWLLANWVPENAKVRQKMLYASSSMTLKKELGAGAIAAEISAAEVRCANDRDACVLAQVCMHLCRFSVHLPRARGHACHHHVIGALTPRTMTRSSATKSPTPWCKVRWLWTRQRGCR